MTLSFASASRFYLVRLASTYHMPVRIDASAYTANEVKSTKLSYELKLSRHTVLN